MQLGSNDTLRFRNAHQHVTSGVGKRLNLELETCKLEPSALCCRVAAASTALKEPAEIVLDCHRMHAATKWTRCSFQNTGRSSANIQAASSQVSRRSLRSNSGLAASKSPDIQLPQHWGQEWLTCASQVGCAPLSSGRPTPLLLLSSMWNTNRLVTVHLLLCRLCTRLRCRARCCFGPSDSLACWLRCRF